MGGRPDAGIGVLAMSDKMTATETLRQLLDERGAEYKLNEYTKVFEWHFDGTDREGSAHATEVNGGINIIACSLTPMQAVEATLGMGTCKMDTFADVKFQDVDEDEEGCYEIGALAECSECGAIVLMPPEYAHFDRESLFAATRFCPNCGRLVEGSWHEAS